jgi:methionyl-tRNA formyltransferase
LLNAFKGLALNIHAGYLPRERGSIVYPKILNNVKSVGVTIHLIIPAIDAGPILYRKQKSIKEKRPTINFLTKENIQISGELLYMFLKNITNDVEIEEINQENEPEKGFFMPQPYTEVNGFVDWNWSAKHIESFVRAFGPPMRGAATFYNGIKVRILEAFIEDCDIDIHPLYYGRIVNITKEGYAEIAANGGLIVIKKIEYKGEHMSPNNILKISNILNTPSNVLENAKTKSVRSLDMEP